MVINPIVGVYIPKRRISYESWDDHRQNREWESTLAHLDTKNMHFENATALDNDTVQVSRGFEYIFSETALMPMDF